MHSACDRCRCARPELVLLSQPRKAPTIWRGVPGRLQDARESDGAVGAYPERRCEMSRKAELKKVWVEVCKAEDEKMYDRYVKAVKTCEKLKRAWYATGQAYDKAVVEHVLARQAEKGGAE